MNYTIDTHSAGKILEEASFNEKQAEAIVKIVTASLSQNFAKIEEITKETTTMAEVVNNTKEKLEGAATKEFVRNEIQSVRTEIQSVRTEIQSTKAETLKWMFGMFFVFSSAQLGILMIILKSFFKGVGGV
jgi:hypothetical protein